VFSITHSRSLGFQNEHFHIKAESKKARKVLINDLRRLSNNANNRNNNGNNSNNSPPTTANNNK